MEKVKCECGHINPIGTIFCESCGKPVEGNKHINDSGDHTKLLDMRYEGTARRSQTYNRSFIDKTWSFFSSVKVGIWLIVITLIASAAGTIFPQEMYIPENAPSRDPAIFYEAQYGILGKIYYQLGFHNLFGSWWYMLLIALIGVSLVICSLDRFVPLHRALKNQKAKRHAHFITRQRLFGETQNATKKDKQLVVESLKKKRYKIIDEDGHILAEKGRFSRWGPYVNHIGLIIILIAALLRFTPFLFLDDYVWVREGERIVIPGTEGKYYIENKKFTLETYDMDDVENERFQAAMEKQDAPIEKSYQTDAVIYEAAEPEITGAEPKLEKIKEDKIVMNHPLKFSGYTLYQAGYQLNEFKTMTFNIHETEDPDTNLDTFTIDLTSPEDEYELDNGFAVKVENYYPDYVLDDNGEPRSKTKYPRNPAYVFQILPPDGEEAEVSFIGIGRNIDATGENKYKLKIDDYEMRDVSGLTVRRDYTLPLFIIGSAIFMIGVIQGMYWQHRRIWIRPDGESMMIAAHTNKNYFGLTKDIENAISGTNINMVNDQKEIDR
jgi:cytochrome c biogenesis protein